MTLPRVTQHAFLGPFPEDQTIKQSWFPGTQATDPRRILRGDVGFPCSFWFIPSWPSMLKPRQPLPRFSHFSKTKVNEAVAINKIN